MDTLDAAASLADSKLADSNNEDWLVSSARSNKSDWSSSQRLGASINSTRISNCYGTSCQVVNTDWLQQHYAARPSVLISRQPAVDYAINNHIYDNISFADSPILRSLSRKAEDCTSELKWNAPKSKRESLLGALSNNFRIFIACYVLLGITMAIYSRNALSLAAVGMIASNAYNKELADLLSGNRLTVDSSRAIEQLEGACPIEPKQHSLDSGNVPVLPSGLNLSDSGNVEQGLRASIEWRINSGELVDWSPGQQGLIFAAGSVGNLLIAIPMTRLGEIYGPKWIIFAATLGATFQAALMPVISTCNVIIVIIFQVIFNGLTYGADCVAYTLFAYWLTPTEMAFFVSCLLICYQMGTIISSFATAKILSENLDWSWCFYTPAILCGLWSLIWALIGSSQPEKSKIISNDELQFLMGNSKIAQTVNKTDLAANHEQSQEISVTNARQQTQITRYQQEATSHSISWLKLAKDPNIWAICSVKFTLRWYFSVYLSLMPTYLSSVAHMSVANIGKMSVVQSFIGLFSGILMGFLTKSLVTKRPFNVSLATTRKFFQSIVNFGLCLSLVIFIIYDCDQWITIATLTLGGICINFYVAAALQLPLDLSPNHCGLITSITNTLAFGQALGAPISGLILNNGPKNRSLWAAVWVVAIILNMVSGLIFILLVDSKPRDYSKKD